MRVKMEAANVICTPIHETVVVLLHVRAMVMNVVQYRVIDQEIRTSLSEANVANAVGTQLLPPSRVAEA